jgi:hypothetical protein
VRFFSELFLKVFFINLKCAVVLSLLSVDPTCVLHLLVCAAIKREKQIVVCYLHEKGLRRQLFIMHLCFQLIIIICEKRTRNVVLAGDGSNEKCAMWPFIRECGEGNLYRCKLC